MVHGKRRVVQLVREGLRIPNRLPTLHSLHSLHMLHSLNLQHHVCLVSFQPHRWQQRKLRQRRTIQSTKNTQENKIENGLF